MFSVHCNFVRNWAERKPEDDETENSGSNSESTQLTPRSSVSMASMQLKEIDNYVPKNTMRSNVMVKMQLIAPILSWNGMIHKDAIKLQKNDQEQIHEN